MSARPPLTEAQIRAVRADAEFCVKTYSRLHPADGGPHALRVIAETTLQALEDRAALADALSALLEHKWSTLDEKFKVQDAAYTALARVGR